MYTSKQRVGWWVRRAGNVRCKQRVGWWVRRASNVRCSVGAGTADVIPQPNLDMLNPTLEDLLEKFEPMEGSIWQCM